MQRLLIVGAGFAECMPRYPPPGSATCKVCLLTISRSR